MKASQSIICKKCPQCSDNYAGDSLETHCCKDGHSLQVIYSDPWIGSTLANRYNIIDFAGSGGWATVYMAEQISLNRKVAVKILDRKLLSSENLVKRFEQEAQALSSLQHPSIVSIIDFGVVPCPYIVMEWLSGQDLSHFQLARTAPLRELIGLFKDLADALQHAHAANIIHRDLKPSNIRVVFNSRNEPKVKILDFGLAKILQSSDGAVLTSTGECWGSPPYMSPEQCMGRQVTSSSDIYSLGCIMYEALAGKAPFTKQSFEEYFAAHISEPPAPIYLNPTVEERGLEAVVQKCLSKACEQRYPSALELLRALEQVVSGSVVEPPVTTCKPKVPLSALICLGCVGVGTIIFAQFAFHSEPNTDPVNRTSSSSTQTTAANPKNKTQGFPEKIHLPARSVRSEHKQPNAIPQQQGRSGNVLAAHNSELIGANRGRSVVFALTDPKPAVRSSSKPINSVDQSASGSIRTDSGSTSASVPVRSVGSPTSGQVPAQLVDRGQLESGLGTQIKSTPSSVATVDFQNMDKHTVTSLVWHDETRGRDVRIHLYQPKSASHTRRPVVLYAPEKTTGAGNNDWLLRRWLNSMFCVIVYDADNDSAYNPHNLRARLELDKQRAQDLVFIVERAQKISKEKDGLFKSTTTDFVLCGEWNSAPAVLAACGAKPDNNFWSEVKSVGAAIRGLILISPAPFGTARCEAYRKMTVPVFVVCTAEDVKRLYWDQDLVSSPAFSRVASRNKFQVFFPRLRFNDLMFTRYAARDQNSVADLSTAFVRAVFGNVPSLQYLSSDEPVKQLGTSANYSFNNMLESEHEPQR